MNKYKTLLENYGKVLEQRNGRLSYRSTTPFPNGQNTVTFRYVSSGSDSAIDLNHRPWPSEQNYIYKVYIQYSFFRFLGEVYFA